MSKTFKSDIDIAHSAHLRDIGEIAAKLGLAEDGIERYGRYKAKVSGAPRGIKAGKAKLILVTAISPTPMGEGKTTTTVGLADALSRSGANCAVALREPSLGPVFGVKGGAAGGGYAQVVPMDDLNLHFTGDFHAIGAANNLLAAMLDNHIHHGNELRIDTKRVVWRRAMDMNDRQLRSIVHGLGGKGDGVTREDGFDITVASEVMAAFCLARDLRDLRDRLGRIIVAYDLAGAPVRASDLKAQGAMAALLADAIKPNLVQTLEGTPVFVHGGPFANIAHGCNSVIATKLAMELADYVVTEAGFGADLGAEKFIDIKCRTSGIAPDAVVIVATVRALKHHGGAPKQDLGKIDLETLERGMENLLRHVDNVTRLFGLAAVVAINRFPTDDESEIALIEERCRERQVEVSLSEVWERGGEGGLDLARKVICLCERENKSELKFAYDLDMSIAEKIRAIAFRVYGAAGVTFLPAAEKEMANLEKLGYGDLPVCMAKTQYSFSDDPKKLGAPSGFTMTVRRLRVCAGAGFIVALTGDIMTMPGLPKRPLAESIDIDEAGHITGIM